MRLKSQMQRVMQAYTLVVAPDGTTADAALDIPEGAIYRYVNTHGPGMKLQLWAEIDPHAPTDRRHFVVKFDGPIPENSVFIGTVPMTVHVATRHVYMLLSPDS